MDIKEYFDIVYYGYLAFGCFLVFILVFYLFGIIMGTCGSVNGPSKKTGAYCLCTGTAIFFIFSSLLWLLATTFFLAGSLSDHLACKLLKEPSESELGSWLDKFINKNLNDMIDTNSSVHYTLS